MTWQERVRNPSVGAIAGLAFLAIGCIIGLEPLRDNSFLTHLATGRFILDTHRVPSHDIYSFTAEGSPWVVQSWLASVLFAAAEKLGGATGIRVLLTATSAALAVLGWRLSRPGETLLARIAATGLLIGVATKAWAERPYLFALVLLAITLIISQERLDPRWLVPVFWLWVNTHGSFPLGLVLLVVVAVGCRLDGEDLAHPLLALRWAVIGTLLGAINPVGPRLLVFPIELLQRSGTLQYIKEWQAPAFTNGSERFFLLEVVLAVVLVARRPSYRSALLLAVFVGAALLGSRNVPVASVILVPIVAEGLRGIGSITTTGRPSIGLVSCAALLAGTGIVVVAGLGQDAYVTRYGYPVHALAWAAGTGLDTTNTPTATQDFVGNYLEAVHGPDANAFFDDRFDMYPEEFVRGYAVLDGGSPGWERVLDRHDVDLVVWAREKPLAQILTASEAWRVLYTDSRFMIACRRGAPLTGSLDRC